MARSRMPIAEARPARKKPLPFPFILDALAPLSPEVRPMFGGHAIYIAEKVVFMLRDNHKSPQDNGLWIVFGEDFDPATDLTALRKEFPSLRSIELLGGAIKHWFLLPADSANFETETLEACERVLARDARFGRIPQSRKSRKSASK